MSETVDNSEQQTVAEPVVYVGSSKVLETVKLDSGNIRVTLFEPQGVPPVLDFTPEQYDSVKSETPYADAQISVRKWRLSVAKMIQILLEANMEMGDMQFVIGRLRDSLIANYGKAVAKKFGAVDEDRITLQQVDEVLQLN